MSIFHKAMLAGAIEIARTEKDDPSLRCVLLEPDGTIVACNRWAIYVAQPVQAKAIKSLPFSSPVFAEPLAVSFDQLANLVKNVPADRQFQGMLEHVSMTQVERTIEYEFNDGKSTGRGVLRCSKAAPVLTGWRARLAGLKTAVQTKGSFAFNRKRLVSVIAAIESACKYDGEFAYIKQEPFPTSYIWSAFNELTSQHVLVAFLMPTAQPTESEWEKSLFTVKKKMVLVKK